MSSSTSAHLPSTPSITAGPASTLSTQSRSTRDRLATRSDADARYDLEHPEALDLEAEVLDAMRPALAGAMARLSGLMPEGNFRELLRGDRTPGLTLREICRLRLSDRSEARRATDALLAVLFSAGGGRNSEAGLTHADVAELVEAASAVMAGLTRFMNGGGPAEAAEQLPLARALAAKVACVIAALETAAQKNGGER